MIEGFAPAQVWLSWLLLAVAAPASVVLPILSALVARSGPIRLRHWAEEAAGSLRRRYEAPASFDAFCLVLHLMARLAPVLFVVALWLVLESERPAAAPWLALAVVGVTLIGVEWANRTLVENHAEVALRRLTVLYRTVEVVARPLVWLLAPLIRRSVARAEDEAEDEDEASDEEIDAFIDVGRREGIIEPGEEQLLRSLVDFGDTQVKSVMTPRVEIAAAPRDATLEELARIFFESKNARLPIYDKSIDHVVGILHIRDLFEALHEQRGDDVLSLAKPPHYVPETKELGELLTELQALHQPMAIVVDEYGGVAGLVTVEDLLEEIVGDINDEHEIQTPLSVKLGDSRWRLEGRTHLEDLEELLELDLDADALPYETVSGLICGELGHVPETGEEVETRGLRFHVESADERRVISVVVERSVAEEAQEA